MGIFVVHPLTAAAFLVHYVSYPPKDPDRHFFMDTDCSTGQGLSDIVFSSCVTNGIWTTAFVGGLLCRIGLRFGRVGSTPIGSLMVSLQLSCQVLLIGQTISGQLPVGD